MRCRWDFSAFLAINFSSCDPIICVALDNLPSQTRSRTRRSCSRSAGVKRLSIFFESSSGGGDAGGDAGGDGGDGGDDGVLPAERGSWSESNLCFSSSVSSRLTGCSGSRGRLGRGLYPIVGKGSPFNRNGIAFTRAYGSSFSTRGCGAARALPLRSDIWYAAVHLVRNEGRSRARGVPQKKTCPIA